MTSSIGVTGCKQISPFNRLSVMAVLQPDHAASKFVQLKRPENNIVCHRDYNSVEKWGQ